MSKPFSFRDLMVVDQTEGAWDDAIGLIAYQYKKRRRGLIGEAVEGKCKECEVEPCECDESFEAQFDALTPTAEDLDESWSDGFVDKFTKTVYNPKENILTLTWRNYEQWPKKYNISPKDGEKLLGDSLQNRSRFLNQLIKDGRLKEIQ